MTDDRTRDEPTPIEEARTDSFDLEHSERVRIGVTRGETDLELGPPRDYPDRADVSVRPESADGHRIVLSIDAMAGDHGTGHADVELTPIEARTLRDRLDDIVRWMTEADADPDRADGTGDGDDAGRH
ncbi:hypothetical protein [Natrinema salaciae]|uniref:Uncharacterized protein n=1 Tax=Natrinema salaciae TaxID=1186196 RepID=A0A1H9LYU6_9EURY|nr:hypothetical protein [Natrinema salaciae]SER16509.1 hypothetical protein SAMN04489841_3136 [Natrinema salaciae]